MIKKNSKHKKRPKIGKPGDHRAASESKRSNKGDSNRPARLIINKVKRKKRILNSISTRQTSTDTILKGSFQVALHHMNTIPVKEVPVTYNLVLSFPPRSRGKLGDMIIDEKVRVSIFQIGPEVVNHWVMIEDVNETAQDEAISQVWVFAGRLFNDFRKAERKLNSKVLVCEEFLNRDNAIHLLAKIAQSEIGDIVHLRTHFYAKQDLYPHQNGNERTWDDRLKRNEEKPIKQQNANSSREKQIGSVQRGNDLVFPSLARRPSLNLEEESGYEVELYRCLEKLGYKYRKKPTHPVEVEGALVTFTPDAELNDASHLAIETHPSIYFDDKFLTKMISFRSQYARRVILLTDTQFVPDGICDEHVMWDDCVGLRTAIENLKKNEVPSNNLVQTSASNMRDLS